MYILFIYMYALDLGEAAFTKVPKKVNGMHSQME